MPDALSVTPGHSIMSLQAAVVDAVDSISYGVDSYLHLTIGAGDRTCSFKSNISPTAVGLQEQTILILNVKVGLVNAARTLIAQQNTICIVNYHGTASHPHQQMFHQSYP
jgi:hypothetical protein